VDKIRRMFKWGVSRQMLPGSNYHALATVEGLKKGRTTAREPKTQYNKDSYSRAVRRAIDKANREITRQAAEAGTTDPQLHPHWHLTQLRHTAGTEIRRHYGLEAAQVVLGHAKADVTQVHAECDQALAADVMRQIG